MGEIAKTDAGKRRIALASARLDATVRDLGQQHREDLPQGENTGDVVQSLPSAEPTELTAPQVLPLNVPAQLEPAEDSGAEDAKSPMHEAIQNENPAGSHRAFVADAQELAAGMDVDVVEEAVKGASAAMIASGAPQSRAIDRPAEASGASRLWH